MAEMHASNQLSSRSSPEGETSCVYLRDIGLFWWTFSFSQHLKNKSSSGWFRFHAFPNWFESKKHETPRMTNGDTKVAAAIKLDAV